MKTQEQVYLEAVRDLEKEIARLKQKREELDIQILTTEHILEALPDIYEQQ